MESYLEFLLATLITSLTVIAIAGAATIVKIVYRFIKGE
jgi:hypothetical protein